MHDIKISLITVTYNAEATIGRCLQSVENQDYTNVEYIIIDGGSTDSTVKIVNQHNQIVNFFVSEPDRGIYDAMNKGIAIATGDVIGILNADDFFAVNDVLSKVATAFVDQDTDIVYGDLNYINPNGQIVRRWVAGAYKSGMFNRGWMPPHPTFYCKRAMFESLGLYDLNFGTAADYELMSRFIHLHQVPVYYLNQVMINMSTGGVSNRSYNNRIAAWKNDYNAMRKNGVKFPLICILFKPLRKIFQYVLT